jgi:hypothetical protein
MKTHWLWKASTLTLAAALALVVGASQNLAVAGPAAPAAQPHMKASLEALENAKSQLEKGSGDKGGHRVKALQLTKEAIEQVKKGIEFDKEHGGDKKDADGT